MTLDRMSRFYPCFLDKRPVHAFRGEGRKQLVCRDIQVHIERNHSLAVGKQPEPSHAVRLEGMQPPATPRSTNTGTAAEKITGRSDQLSRPIHGDRPSRLHEVVSAFEAMFDRRTQICCRLPDFGRHGRIASDGLCLLRELLTGVGDLVLRAPFSQSFEFKS